MQLLKTIFKHTEARNAYLLIKEEYEWQVIDSMGPIDAQQMSIKDRRMMGAVTDVVSNTKQVIVMADARYEISFYTAIASSQELPKSIACLPLVDNAVVSGMLYLENTEKANCFTPQKMGFVSQRTP